MRSVQQIRFDQPSETQYISSIRVKSGNFGHQVNAKSGNPYETASYEPSNQDFDCLLKSYSNYLKKKNQTWSLSEFTWLYCNANL